MPWASPAWAVTVQCHTTDWIFFQTRTLLIHYIVTSTLAGDIHATSNLTFQGRLLFRLVATFFRLRPNSLELAAGRTAFQQTFIIQLLKGTEDVFYSNAGDFFRFSALSRCL